MFTFAIIVIIILICLIFNYTIRNQKPNKQIEEIANMDYEQAHKMFYALQNHFNYTREYSRSDEMRKEKLEKGEIYGCRTYGEASELSKAVEDRLNYLIDNEPDNPNITNFERVMSKVRRMPAKNRSVVYDELIEFWNQELTKIPVEERKKNYKNAEQAISNNPIIGVDMYGCKTYGEVNQLIEAIICELNFGQ